VQQVVGLFPIPIMRVERLIDTDLVTSLVREVTDTTTIANTKSDRLSHSRIVSPGSKDVFARMSLLIQPKLVEFGSLLFGESLDWSIKEIWVNLLETSGHQSIHNHANSFVSGVLYLTSSHPSANLVFHKALGGTDFVFSNQNKSTRFGPFNGNKWATPAIFAGDLILFPSYLLHEVPTNRGDRRISVAFNAIPTRLDSFGYTVHFS
jgi:uncharacterized protein (TIGR02466 family)